MAKTEIKRIHGIRVSIEKGQRYANISFDLWPTAYSLSSKAVEGLDQAYLLYCQYYVHELPHSFYFAIREISTHFKVLKRHVPEWLYWLNWLFAHALIKAELQPERNQKASLKLNSLLFYLKDKIFANH